MDIFSSIFLEVQTRNRNLLYLPFDRVTSVIAFGGHYLELAVCGKWPVVLRDLIALGQVWIEVVLARKNRLVVDAKTKSQRRARAQFHRATIQHRQRARQTQADRASVFVGLVAKARRAATENFRLGAQLSMNLKADNCFPTSHRIQFRVFEFRVSSSE